MHTRALLASAAFAVCCLAADAALAQAQSGDAAMAETLFNEGKRKMAAGDYAGACPKLSESYRLDPGTGTLTALAVCHENQGRTASAWTEFLQVVSEAKQTGRADREAFAQQHIDVLEPNLSKLTVVVDPAVAGLAGLEVKRDGTVIGQAGWGTAAPVDPGPHTVGVTAPGKKPWSASVTVGAASDLQTITVPSSLEDAPSQGPSPAGESISNAAGGSKVESSGAATGDVESPEQPPAKTGSARRTTALVIGGAGVVAAGIGTYFGLQAISKSHDANNLCAASPCVSMEGVNDNQDAKSAAVAADIAFGGALVAIGVGAVLYLTAPSAAAPPPSSALRIVPVLTARGVSMTLDAIW